VFKKDGFKKDGIIRIGDSNDKFFHHFNGIDEKTYHDFVDQYMLYKVTDDLIIDIETVGGSLTYSFSEIISRHTGKTVARITRNAFSGGTIIALACDKIKMTRTAALSCIDPQSSYIGSIRHAKEPLAMASKQDGWIGLISKIMTNYYNETDKNFERQMTDILYRKHPHTNKGDQLFSFFTKNRPHDAPLTIHALSNALDVELYEPEPEEEQQIDILKLSAMVKSAIDNDFKHLGNVISDAKKESESESPGSD
jgi:ATP-dependent protease ClpP protease subunit